MTDRVNETTPQQKKEGALMRFASVLLERVSLASRAGLRFDGKRDYWEVFGYKQYVTLEDYMAKYTRQDIAARIIDAPVSATWREPPIVEGNPAFNTAWEEFTKDQKVWNNLERADRLCGLGEYSVLLYGFDGNSRLETPVATGDREMLYMQPYAQLSCAINRFDNDPQSERFGRPLEYEITIQTPTTSRRASTDLRSNTFKVHWTRVLHVVDANLDDDVFGIPRLSKVFNLLDDLLKVAGGTAETYWLESRGGMHADVDKEMTLDPEDEAALTDEIDEYIHELRRTIRTRGVDIKNLTGTIPRPGESFDMLISLISGATGIPRRILTGSEAGQLASEQDRANWSDRISERQISFAEPMVLRPFVDRMQQTGVLPESDYGVQWPENFKLTPLEQGQMMAQKARATTNFSRQFEKGWPIVTQEEARDIMMLPEAGGPDQPGERPPQPPQQEENPENPPQNLPNGEDRVQR